MSVYQNAERMREWARIRLERVLDRDRYPQIFKAIDPKRARGRLSGTQLGVLRLLLDSEWRPDRDPSTQARYGTSACLTKAEIGEVVGRSTSAVGKAISHLNILARQGAAENDTLVKKVGLILFTDLGCCFRPNLGDTNRARSYSTKQLGSQSSAHLNNIDIANDKDSAQRVDDEVRNEFERLTPEERRQLMRSMTQQASAQ